MAKRIVNGIYLFLTLLLGLMVVNHFTSTLVVSPLLTFVVLVLAALLFFIRIWMRRGY